MTSDHFLVKTIIKQKLIRTQTNVVKKVKWNQNNLQNTTKLKQYKTCLCDKLNKKGVQHNIEEEWTHIKQTIIEAANESIQTQNAALRNEWWDEECKQAMTQKNEARKEYLQAKTRASREIYEIKRTEANKICRRKKRDWINSKIKYIEELNDKKETQKFFKEAQFFNKHQSTLPNCCKDKDGNILSEQKDILQTWKQYFCDLQSLNESQTVIRY